MRLILIEFVTIVEPIGKYVIDVCFGVFVVIAKATNLLKEPPSGFSQLDKNDLQTDIALFHAATALQVKNLETVSLGEVRKNVLLIQLNEHAIPNLNAAIITRKHASICFEDRKIDEWSKCTELPMAGDGSSHWDVNDMRFAAVQGFGLLKVGEEDEDFKAGAPNQVTHQWILAMLGDPFSKLLGSVPDGDDAKRLVVKAMRAWMAKHSDHIPFSARDVPVDTMVALMQKVFRGFLGLLCDILGACGATLDDVNYVYPANGTTAQIMKDLPKVGRALVNKMRRHVFWKDHKERFEKYLPQDVLRRFVLKRL